MRISVIFFCSLSLSSRDWIGFRVLSVDWECESRVVILGREGAVI